VLPLSTKEIITRTGHKDTQFELLRV